MEIDFVEFGALALAHLLALISPGPDFFLIVGSSFQHGYRKTLWLCLGVAVANGAYIVLAIGGFSLLRESTPIFWGMKLVAAGYLFYLGSLLVKSSRRSGCAEAAETHVSALTVGQLFIRGFLSAILNPKNAIFYLSLMALIVSRQTPVAIQLVYAVWMFSIVLFWDALIAWCVGTPRLRGTLDTQAPRLERISGAMLMLVGVFIVLK